VIVPLVKGVSLRAHDGLYHERNLHGAGGTGILIAEQALGDLRATATTMGGELPWLGRRRRRGEAIRVMAT
jgi:hypothetical protein